MMLREEKITSVLRFHHDDAAGYRDSPDVVTYVLWNSPTWITLVAMKGEHTRKSFREFLQWLSDQGVTHMRNERAGGSGNPSPLAVRGPDGWDTTVVADLVARFGVRLKA